MRKNKILIYFSPVIFILSVAIFSGSCTMDYFVDETNYMVYVPQVENRTVRDCHIFVYDSKGNLAGTRSAAYPFDESPRIESGRFGFMLQRGDYEVFCFTDADSVNFVETGSLTAARLRALPVSDKLDLIDKDAAEHAFMQPSGVHYDNFTTRIESSIVREDTASLRRYVGRITVLFKNMPVHAATISSSRLLAHGVGQSQYFNRQGSSRDSDSKFMFAWKTAQPAPSGYDYMVDNTYFPSIAGELMTLNMRFFDPQETVTGTIDMELRDPDTGLPLTLVSGQRLVIEVDNYFINKISIVGWDDDIDSGGGIVVE